MTESERVAWFIAIGQAKGGQWSYRHNRWVEEDSIDAKQHREAATLKRG